MESIGGKHIVIHQINGGHTNDCGAICIPLCNQVVKGLRVCQNRSVPGSTYSTRLPLLPLVGLGLCLLYEFGVSTGSKLLNFS